MFSLAYLDVRSDKSDTKWLLLDYESDRSDKLNVTQTGTGGLSELTKLLDDSKASFGYVRVSYSNDKESVREKFALVVRSYLAFSSYPSICLTFVRFGLDLTVK